MLLSGLLGHMRAQNARSAMAGAGAKVRISSLGFRRIYLNLARNRGNEETQRKRRYCTWFVARDQTDW